MQQQDVRRPKNVHPYPAKKQAENDDNGNASLYQFMSLIIGMVSFIFRVINLINIDIGQMGLLGKSSNATCITDKHQISN